MSESSSKQPSSWRMYPSLSLQQAIDKIAMLYASERRATVALDIAMKAMGYNSATSGPSTSARSALKQFGLLEEVGSGASRKVGVSAEGYNILEGPDSVRREAIRKAALRPATNKLIWDEVGPNAGSDENFAWQLEHEYGFSRNGAIDFVKKFKQTLEFAGIVSSNGEVLAADGDEDKESLSPSDSETEIDPPRSDQGKQDFLTSFMNQFGDKPLPKDPESVARGAAFVESFLAKERERTSSAPQVSPPTASAPGVGVSRHAIPLVGGRQVILEGEFPLSEAAWAGFMTVLQAFKPGLVADDVV